MKIDDVNAFKGAVKDAVVSWGNKKIEELFKGKPIEQFTKKALKNFITREDEKINGYVDNAFLFLADETGAVDSDTVIDDLLFLFLFLHQTTTSGIYVVDYWGDRLKNQCQKSNVCTPVKWCDAIFLFAKILK